MFVDSRQSVGLPEAPQPGSMSQDVFVGEGCHFECAEAIRAGKGMTKCAAVNPEADSECRENSTFRRVVKVARTVRAREKAEKGSTCTMSIQNNNSIFSQNECLRLAPKPGEPVWVLGNVGKGKENSRQNDKPQNKGTARHNYVESPVRSSGETPWAQGTTETEENSNTSRQSYLDHNINSSRQNDNVLIALTSSQGKSVK